MPKSEFAATLDAIQDRLGAPLKDRGFRARGRTFNRVTADGLTHVLNVQMGSFDPPGTTYNAGLRENLYGWFTINLGVYVPEVARWHGGGTARSWVREHNCCLRSRLGELGREKRDLWWSLAKPEEVTIDLDPRIRNDALGYFSRYGSRDQILARLHGVTENISAGSPPRIISAIIYAERGDKTRSRALLVEQVKETRNPGHPAYVRELAANLGLEPLTADNRWKGREGR